jgi:sensor histidine kinase YesM
MLVVLFWYLSANVVAPIGELVDAMHGGGDGSLRKVSDKKNLSKEFGILYSSYNEMISEIADLKIAEYEKQLELQNEKIIGLMSQIKPHFYLNAISTIQGMTYQHREEDIRAFIQNLSKYLRYTFNSHERDVSLQEELESCQSYIEMQKIRFPGKIFYFCETAEVNMREIKVAPLILHTLIENCFKHAQDPQEILTILMRISGKTESDGTKGTEIILEDNGQGFPDNILKEQGNCRKKESGIGLYNIRRILELTYARTDLFEISNTIPHGARVRIFLPERKEKNIL